MFGRCANGRISRKQKLELMTSHRFYLAFENNNCDEYVTEKFFEALRFGIVPVVYGARKEYYEQIAPSHSFIHLEDFERVEHLAAYLHYLTNNQTAYNEYFHWKHKYYVSETKFFCRLCKLLQDPPANTYGDIEELWHQRSSCSSIPV
ncbi:hypothetical protein M3Y94_00301700 [Aphelenchoides besseyi]|nr:hypothetical protein M3Y94_00301700 [Aphelenchoides besseyi]